MSTSLMINYVNSPPPESLYINGTEYPINTDYRVWLEVSCILEDLDSTDENENIIKTFEHIVELVFGTTQIPENMNDVLNAVIEFQGGYPTEPSDTEGLDESTNTDNERVISFKHDINYIIVAIRNQSGIDLSYKRKEPFHWWEFLLEFNSLEDRHFISRLISIRSYDGDDKDRLRLKEKYKLPVKLTAEEKKVNEMFYAT